MTLARPAASPAALLLAVLLLVLLAGCDSGDPIDAPLPADVDGTYRLTQLRFEPEAQGLAPADVMTALDSSETQLLLTSNSRFLLLYRFEGDLYLLQGTFDVSRDFVQLEGDDAELVDYQRVLLSPSFTLRRDDDVLWDNIVTSVNLEAYDPQQYAGLQSVRGTLRIRFELSDDPGRLGSVE